MNRLLIGTAVLLLAAGCSSEEAIEESAEPPKPVEAAAAPPPAKPSFDCAAASSDSQKLVCASPELSQMDAEAARLYVLSETGSSMSPVRVTELKDAEAKWAAARDACGAAAEAAQCLKSSYAEHIHRLRQGSPDARSADVEGISTGPDALHCDGQDFGIGITFVNADPGSVYMEWLDKQVTLSRIESASGSKYTGKGDGGDYTFWTQGEEALFTLPGKPDAKCTFEEIG